MSTFFERLMQVANLQGIKNANELADALNYKSPEKLYRLQRDKNANPGYTILFDISNLFENLDLNWLLTGKKNSNIAVHTPPYNLDFGMAKEENETYTPIAKSHIVSPKTGKIVSPTVSPTHKNCQLCGEKERTIAHLEDRISELKDHIHTLKNQLDSIGTPSKESA